MSGLGHGCQRHRNGITTERTFVAAIPKGHQHHLGMSWKCGFLGPTPDTLNQEPDCGAWHSVFKQALEVGRDVRYSK